MPNNYAVSTSWHFRGPVTSRFLDPLGPWSNTASVWCCSPQICVCSIGCCGCSCQSWGNTVLKNTVKATPDRQWVMRMSVSWNWSTWHLPLQWKEMWQLMNASDRCQLHRGRNFYLCCSLLINSWLRDSPKCSKYSNLLECVRAKSLQSCVFSCLWPQGL